MPVLVELAESVIGELISFLDELSNVAVLKRSHSFGVQELDGFIVESVLRDILPDDVAVNVSISFDFDINDRESGFFESVDMPPVEGSSGL